jgi:parallel beta-helix repeat protein
LLFVFSFPEGTAVRLTALRKILTPKSTGLIRRPALRAEALEDRWVPAVLTVDGDGGKQFTTITAAIAAAGTNDTIRVYDAAHDYTEQLTIPASKTGLKIVGAEPGVVIDSPATATPAAVAGANVGAALIDVRATKVEIRNLTLNGATNTDGNLSAGIRVVEGGSATISDNTITGLKTTNNLQFGIGVEVGISQLGTVDSVGTATVQDNVISDYVGAGVVVDAAGSSADVRGNTITGRGAANGGVAEYGVQVSFGASARVEQNTITANSAPNSGGVLLYQVSGKNVVVAKNTVGNNDVGIWLFQATGTGSGGPQVRNNDVTNSGSDGILIDSSDNVGVKNNDVSGGDGDGIAVFDSTAVAVKNNESSDNGGDGIFLSGGSGNTVANNATNNNGGDGIGVESSSDNRLCNNTTRGNALNGVSILGGSGTDLLFGKSAANGQDGILLQDTTGTRILAYTSARNSGYGLRLLNADNTLIACSVFRGNGQGSIFISPDSTGVIKVGNQTAS